MDFIARLDEMLTKIKKSMTKRSKKQRSLYLERNKVNRLLMIAVAEDDAINKHELQTMICILLRRYLTDDIKGNEFSIYCKDYYNLEINNEKQEYIDLNTFIYPECNYLLKKCGYSDSFKIESSTLKYLLVYYIYLHLGHHHLLGTLNDEKRELFECLHEHRTMFETYLMIHGFLFDCLGGKPMSMDGLGERAIAVKKLIYKLYGGVDNSNDLMEPIIRFHHDCALALLVLQKCYDELNNKDDLSIARSLFTNVNLLNKDEKKQELIDMYGIIHSDYSVMDKERESFRIVCKMFQIKHTSLLLQQIVEKYNEFGEKILLRDSQFLELNFKLTIVNKNNFSVSDYSYIKDALVTYEIRGPIKDGVYHVLKRDRMDKDERTYRFDRKMSRIAITIFSLSALFLYAMVSLKLSTHSGGNLFASVENIFNDYIGVHSKTIIDVSFVLFIVIILLTIVKNLRLKIKKRQYLKIQLFPSWRIWVLRLSTISMAIALLKFAQIISLFHPIVILCMMLSIEWLIFMKTESEDSRNEQNNSQKCKDENDKKDAQKKTNASLYLLTIVAILLDMGLGFVDWVTETINHDNITLLLAKLASAIVLGAICFFSGKFLDMHREQQKQDRDTMNRCIETIKAGE